MEIAGLGKGIKPKRFPFFFDCAINTPIFRLRFTLPGCAKLRRRKKKKNETAGNINDVCKWNSLRQKDLFRMSFGRVFSSWLTFVLNSTCCQRWSYLYLAPAWPSFCPHQIKWYIPMEWGGCWGRCCNATKENNTEVNKCCAVAWHRMRWEKTNREKGGAWVAGGIVRNISSCWLVCIVCNVFCLWIAICSSTKEIATTIAWELLRCLLLFCLALFRSCHSLFVIFCILFWRTARLKFQITLCRYVLRCGYVYTNQKREPHRASPNRPTHSAWIWWNNANKRIIPFGFVHSSSSSSYYLSWRFFLLLFRLWIEILSVVFFFSFFLVLSDSATQMEFVIKKKGAKKERENLVHEHNNLLVAVVCELAGSLTAVQKKLCALKTNPE